MNEKEIKELSIEQEKNILTFLENNKPFFVIDLDKEEVLFCDANIVIDFSNLSDCCSRYISWKKSNVNFNFYRYLFDYVHYLRTEIYSDKKILAILFSFGEKVYKSNIIPKNKGRQENEYLNNLVTITTEIIANKKEIQNTKKLFKEFVIILDLFFNINKDTNLSYYQDREDFVHFFVSIQKLKRPLNDFIQTKENQQMFYNLVDFLYHNFFDSDCEKVLSFLTYEKMLLIYKLFNKTSIYFIDERVAKNYVLNWFLLNEKYNNGNFKNSKINIFNDTRDLILLRNKKRNEQLKNIYLKYCNTILYENDQYKILLPSCVNDFIDEGNQQHNCVVNYIDTVIKGKNLIVFMRNKNNLKKSLVTIELSLSNSGLTLTQALTFKNEPISDDNILNFLDSFKKNLLTNK